MTSPMLQQLSNPMNRATRSPQALRLVSCVNARAFGTFKAPPIRNEPNPSYSKGSVERQKLQDAITRLKSELPIKVPSQVSQLKDATIAKQHIPSDHSTVLAEYPQTTPEQVQEAITRALEAKNAWENTSFTNRAAIFLRAAELIAGQYRESIMAATMLGQGKNIWQAEIDSAAESVDFLRFNVHYAAELYKQQNILNDAGVWNRTEYRPLEGFVYAISPFNFTAIGANLTVAPAIMGNVVLWKPSDYALYSSHLLHKILLEAGLPPNVIQLIPGKAEPITSSILQHPKFAALHFTGSTDVFRQLYGRIGQAVAEGRYESYPRIVGETGGKNFHLVHGSADVRNAVVNTIRGAFEYQGQKCSATSRLYVAESVWPEFKKTLLEETGKLKVGSPEQVNNFIGPVIHERSWNKLKAVIDKAKKDPEVELLAGGNADKSKGWFVSPTIFQTTNPANELMRTEFFGPILSVYVYPDEKYEELLPVIDSTTQFSLTGAVFARDTKAIEAAENGLRHSAGNFYINSKSSGAVVGHQPFGGGRASGTNDKATSTNLLARFTSIRSLKEDFVGADTVLYPSNEV
ncbi:Delta-1-pyrroline-5-carboxylate dehydrogenase [Colletotrichum fructicola]|uniref:Multifunctional fusion protein n=1 Tax=Colletotrichum fructicola (strain Nara gc5) TaxID=1213859 RepID=L2FJS0_COLFN|nr:Delta-1-pyrroline-5-carboxylate dehydrogenase [Colletotrichum fructicola]KAE9571219.1 Delta-1-pyrroline-5-carboxylate dehydrogenase [Colletotrichum fructicola]KAF4490139.1 Delta-1-pyrroline-5-carboxylate dehydrogenase [Colletotrichum fructicola Nara gc5]KAF4905836.1 Delta-1-pyrroline-5-carboxylate dehydrogenase [Colletotrichum fructicola]KAF4917055.1 Delta-1-pyrroline-5-carboxylate dehydrogenase [Colletotrichum fructicola]